MFEGNIGMGFGTIGVLGADGYRWEIVIVGGGGSV
jgi:hypothetical protein